MLLISCILRLLPHWVSSLSHARYFVHAGQIIGGMASPIALLLPPVISGAWFGDRERTMCSGVSVASRQLGIAAGLYSNHIFSSAGGLPSTLEHLLLCELGIACALALAVVVYFPRLPPSFPGPLAQKAAAIQGNYPAAEWGASPAAGSEWATADSGGPPSP